MRNVTGSYEDDEKLKALFTKHLLPHTNSFDSFVLQVTVRKREVNAEADGEETAALSWALVTLSDEAAVLCGARGGRGALTPQQQKKPRSLPLLSTPQC